jgi:ligand-binding sensor domain-containing protein/signal transduction histidine kinase
VISRAELAFSLCICRIILIAIFIANCAPVYALHPDYPPSKYIHTSWGSDDGLDPVRELAQTPDGYLWLSTTSGLVRFDGVRFTRYARADGQSLDNSVPLIVDPDGSLWVGTHDGVIAHLKSGKFHAYSSRDGLPSEEIHSLFRDSQGVLWVGTRGHGIFRMAHDRFEKLSLGIPPTSFIPGFLEDSDHALWIATWGDGVFRLQNGRLRSFSVKDGLPDAHVAALYRDHLGKIWTAGVNGISAWNGTRFVGQPAVNSLVRYGYAIKCTEDRDGNLWIATWSGLLRLRAGQVTKIDASSGLSAGFLWDVFVDREGNIWVATNRGLDRFRDEQVRTFTRLDGLFRKTAAFKWPIVADRGGGVWIAAGRQVVRITASKITAWPMALPFGSEPQTMLFEPDSGFLVGFGKGLKHWSPAHAELTPELEDLDVRCLFQSRDGSVWIGTANRGLLHWKSYPRPETQLDAVIPDRFITTLTEDRDGTIWAGSHGGGLYRIAGEQVQHFGQSEGLRSSTVYTVYVDREGALWIGTAGGLSWFQEGRIRTVSSEQGLRSDMVLAILDDPSDRLWFLSHSTIAAIEKKSLTEWATGRLTKLNATYYRNADGWQELSSEGTFPSAVQSADGHMWFALLDGFAEVTPSNPRLSYKVEFPVVVEDVTIDGISHSEPNRIQISPGAHSVEIRYTALTLSNSDTIQFRYRLEGFDDHWVDADTRRFALYNNLKPGTYTFKVEASAVEDQWQKSSPLSLEQIPFFYQTNWFLILVAAAAVSLIFLMYRLRLRLAVDRIKAGFQQKMDERTRIARELHDTLLQSLQGLMLHFQTGIDLLPGRPVEARKTLEIAVDRADQAINEGRDAVQGLRASAVETNDLVSAVRILGEELGSADTNQNSVVFEAEVEGVPRNLHPVLGDEVYRIAAEALRNAFRHAHAQRIEVEILYGDRWLRLRVRDDGKGIDPMFLSADGRAKHYGLHGMRERAQLVGGKLAVWSKLDSGTEVDLSIPASTAYATSYRRRSWLSERLSRRGTNGKKTDVKETKMKS